MTEQPEQNSELDSTTQEADIPAEYPGKRLQEVREAAHLSREEVARNLHLDTQLIVALEENIQDKLPPPAYVCGYLRSYARLLKLPEDEIVENYNQGRELETPLVPENIEIRSSSAAEGQLGKIAIVLLVVVVLAAVYIWRDSLPFFGAPTQDTNGADAADNAAASREPDEAAREDSTQALPAPFETPANSQESPIEDSMREQALEQVPADTSEPGLSGEQATLSGDANNTDAPEPIATEATTAPTAPPTVAADDDNATRATADSATSPAAEAVPAQSPVLRLEYADASWTEVRDANGRVLVFRLVTAGSEINLAGEPPFTILLGYAPGVQVYYEGKAFELSRFTRGDIAYFEVGQQAAEDQ